MVGPHMVGSYRALLGSEGPIKAYMGPYGPIWGPYGPIWAHMGPYGPVWARVGPARAHAVRETISEICTCFEERALY